MFWQGTVLRIAYRLNAEFGIWLAPKLGFKRFVDDEIEHDHAPGCTDKHVHTEVRRGGMVTRCRHCGYAVRIKFSYWEEEPGIVPAYVVEWLTDEMRTVLDVQAVGAIADRWHKP